jgi:hypothetical protein
MRRIGLVALVGGLCLADYGLGVTGAAAAPPLKEGDLAGVTQNWDKVMPATQRFTVLEAFNNAAVRDNETGLVWEQSPEAQRRSSLDARFYCAHIKKVGNRKGWRVPSLPELSTLLDTSKAVPGPFLPDGHPFGYVQLDDNYWSATGNADDPTQAWTVNFGNSNVNLNPKTYPLGFYVWCVRGPMQESAY